MALILPRALILAVLLLAGCAGQPAPRPEPVARPEPVPTDSERLIQRIERENGPQAAARVSHWFALIEQGKSAPDPERLRLANNFFNAARFTTDPAVWQQQDYWATPIEFLIKDAGDCEEFAIAKYFTLSRMGIAEDALRITYVQGAHPSPAPHGAGLVPRPRRRPPDPRQHRTAHPAREPADRI